MISRARQASLRAVDALGLLRGDDDRSREADRATLQASPEVLYKRLNSAYPRHRSGRQRNWCSLSLFRVAKTVDAARSTDTFEKLYRLLYVNASQTAHSDPSTVGRVRGDHPLELHLGPDPTGAVAVTSALVQLLIGGIELVNEACSLDAEEQIKATAVEAVDALQVMSQP